MKKKISYYLAHYTFNLKKMTALMAIAMSLASLSLKAQIYEQPATGSVGIGILSPQAKLHVFGGSQIGDIRIGGSNGANNGRVFIQADFIRNNSYIDAYGDDQYKKLSIEAFPLVLNNASVGNVGIGTANPTEKLSVNGNIRAREIKVENSNWPDYVFSKSYDLPKLSVIEEYIKEKGHLPGIPSAIEVKEKGIDLGDLNARLLQKIEELTLHLIKMEKENEQQRNDINELKSKLK